MEFTLLNIMVYYLMSNVETALMLTADKKPVDEIFKTFGSEGTVAGRYQFPIAWDAVPPEVKPPPYLSSSIDCPGVDKPYMKHKTSITLCGDLNKGFIPRNPMNQNIDGKPYPFELMSKKTLQFLSRTLPVLQSDETIPRVTDLHMPSLDKIRKKVSNRIKKSEQVSFQSTASNLKNFLMESANIVNLTNQAKQFCNNSGGMVCLVYKAMQGERLGLELDSDKKGITSSSDIVTEADERSESEPPTPCPAVIEYATPVFARNYQGIWRYIVQIPYEGYFTQTVEITKCLNSKCHYIDGRCLSSPRWVSLLVAEIIYSEDTSSNPDSLSEEKQNDKMQHCDGRDKNGCYEVRLYYDWFLIPGSCKCWRPNYLRQFSNSN